MLALNADYWDAPRTLKLFGCMRVSGGLCWASVFGFRFSGASHPSAFNFGPLSGDSGFFR
jgi:hypothetical protein